MNLFFTINNIAVGISFWVAVNHFFIGVRKKEKSELWLGITAFFTTCYTFFYGLAVKSGTTTYFEYTRWSVNFILFSLIAFTYFVATYTKSKDKIIKHALAFTFLCFLGINTYLPYTMIHHNDELIYHLLWWGELLIHGNTDTFLWRNLFDLCMAVFFIYALWLTWEQYWNGNRKRSVVLFLGLVLLLLTATNDILSAYGLSAVQISQYGFILFVALLNLFFAEEIIDAAEVKQELIYNHERYTAIMDSLPIAVFLTNKEQNITFANTYVKDFLQTPDLDSLKKNYSDVLDNHAVRVISKQTQYLFAYNQVVQTEMPLTNKQGITLNCVLYCVPILKKQQLHEILYVAVDISKQKQHEQELQHYRDELEKLVQQTSKKLENTNTTLNIEIARRRETEEDLLKNEIMFRAVFEQSFDAISVVDKKGNYRYVNEAFLQMTGYSRTEIMQKKIADLLPDNRKALLFSAISQQNIKAKREAQIRRKDGTLVDIDVFATPLDLEIEQEELFMAIIRDITLAKQQEKEILYAKDRAEKQTLVLQQAVIKQRETEDALRKSETFFRTIFEQSFDAIIIVDNASVCQYINPASTKLTGYSRNELQGKSINEFVSEGIQIMLAQKVLKQNKNFGTEFEFLTHDKSKKWVEIFVTPIMIEKQLHALIIMRDVSQRRYVENQMRQAIEIAQGANKAKSEFLANMSHELRTPLNAIMGFAQLIRTQPNITEQQQRNLTTIHQSGEHLLAIIEDILDMSRIEADRMQLNILEIRLPDLVEQVYSMNKNKAQEKQLEFLLQGVESLPLTVQGDERRVKQILINLVSNAIKYTLQGSVHIHTSYNFDLQILVVEVKDTGIGISEKKQSEVFLPFVQVRNKATEGTGLGLAITRKLVELMNGSISLESTLGKGSAFKVNIPLKMMQSSEDHEIKHLKHIVAYKGNEKTILIVEDKASNQSLFDSILEPIGFKIIHADNGQQAIDIIPHLMPDMIILDLVMPITNGIEVAQYINNSDWRNNVKILGTSAALSDKKNIQLFSSLCNDFLPRPFDSIVLLTKIEQLLNIEWVYDNNNNESDSNANVIVLPPDNVLDMIIEYANKGTFDDIAEQVSILMQQNKAYTAFAKQILDFADKFNDDGIKNFIKEQKNL